VLTWKYVTKTCN